MSGSTLLNIWIDGGQSLAPKSLRVLKFPSYPTASISDIGQGLLRYNDNTHTFQTSVNGGAWTDIGGGGGSIGGSIATQQVAFGVGVNTIGGSPDITYDGLTLALDASQTITGGISIGTAYQIDSDNVLRSSGDVPTFLGTDNTFVGYQSGPDTYTAGGDRNTVIGSLAGRGITTATTNVFIGFHSGRFTTTGGGNVFIGDTAGAANTTGNAGVFIGVQAGQNNTTGIGNVFVGSLAGLLTTSGGNNTFIGTDNGSNNTIGHNNTFVGFSVGNSNVDGNYNVAMGYGALDQNIGGSENTCYGNYAGFNNITGSNNTFIGGESGYTDGVITTPDGLTNATAIGYAAQVTTSNSLILGGAGAFAVNVGIGLAAPTASLHVLGNVIIGAASSSSGAQLYVTEPAASSGSPNIAEFKGALHTALAAGVPDIDIYFNLAREVIYQTGDLTDDIGIAIGAKTISFVGASNLAFGITQAIEGGPVAGANVTSFFASTAQLINTWASNSQQAFGQTIFPPGIANGVGDTGGIVGAFIGSFTSINVGNQTATTTDFANIVFNSVDLISTTNTRTFTNAASVVITGPPTNGGNVVFTNPEMSLWVLSGNTRLDGGILSTGGTGDTLISGAGTRLMWIPSKASIRAGVVTGTEWDDANIGQNSTAFGRDSVASGQDSVSIGNTNTASGDYSSAFGSGGQAFGNFSHTAGQNCLASGLTAVALGVGHEAIADHSTALGQNVTITGTGSVGIGLDGAGYFIGSNNVLSIMGGNVGIGVLSPVYPLDIAGDVHVDLGKYIGVTSPATAANDTTLGYSNVIIMSGNTQINRFGQAGWPDGTQFKIIFTGTPLVKNNQASGGGFGAIHINGSADYQAAANSIVDCVVYNSEFYMTPFYGAAPSIISGTATLASGTITISAAITASSRIVATIKDPNPGAGNLTIGLSVPNASRNVGAGTFVIQANVAAGTINILDTSTLDWVVVG